MIDNLNKLQKYIDLLKEDEFLYIEIIIRNKDSGNLGRNSRILKTYKLTLVSDLSLYINEIKKLCKSFNARAYLYISPRNEHVVFSDMLSLLATYNKYKNYKTIHKVFNKAVKETKGTNKHFLFDVDSKDHNYLKDVIVELKKSAKVNNIENPIIDIFETVNGFHVITKPLNYYKTFKDKFPEIEIHKNNPTLLYYDGEV